MRNENSDDGVGSADSTVVYDLTGSGAEASGSQVVEPSSGWLTIHSVARIQTLLRQRKVIASDEVVTDIYRAGEGNMNLTLRVRTSARNVVVKQSRPWVEKYPTIAAPVERILQELNFYNAVSADQQLAARMPRLLGSLPAEYVVILECLGEANDAATLYSSDDGPAKLANLLPDLVAWLERLHQLQLPAGHSTKFANRALRTLNHEHIFVVPFQAEPALDLDAVTQGLANVARRLSQNGTLAARLEELGTRYLTDGQHLVHGDFFPGSWLICQGEVRIIDPEFSHAGLPEFDLGVLLAHGQLLGCDDAGAVLCDQLRQLYSAESHPVDWQLVKDFAAVEILRRLLGVAQLPLTLDLAQKQAHVDRSVAQLVG